MGVLFLVSAYLQLNDPDSWLWIVIYIVAAMVSFWHNILPRALLLTCVALSLAAITYLILAINDIDWRGVFGSFNMQGQGVEEVREIGGLLIIAVWFTILAYVKKRKIRT